MDWDEPRPDTLDQDVKEIAKDLAHVALGAERELQQLRQRCGVVFDILENRCGKTWCHENHLGELYDELADMAKGEGI